MMAPTTPLEKAWLNYARGIIGCDDEHLKQCRRLRKPSFPNFGLDDSIRWPGNLGSNYERTCVKVLCLAQIHNDRVLDLTARGFEPAMRDFRDGSIGDSKFLQCCREYYEKQIPNWGTWRKFTDILPSQVTVADIAYANIAKCWAPAWTRVLRVDNQPTMTACNERFPIHCLVDLLKPDLIVQVGRCGALDGQLFTQKRFVVAGGNFPGDRADRAEKAKLVRALYDDLCAGRKRR